MLKIMVYWDIDRYHFVCFSLFSYHLELRAYLYYSRMQISTLAVVSSYYSHL